MSDALQPGRTRRKRSRTASSAPIFHLTCRTLQTGAVGPAHCPGAARSAGDSAPNQPERVIGSAGCNHVQPARIRRECLQNVTRVETWSCVCQQELRVHDVRLNTKTRERESEASRCVDVSHGIAITLSTGAAAIFLIARASGRAAYMGHHPGMRRPQSHTASRRSGCGVSPRSSSVSASACVVLRAAAAVTGAPAPTVSKASLRASARSGPEAQLSQAGNTQLIGRRRALAGRRRRARGSAEHRLYRAIGTLVSAAGDHQLPHPIRSLIARARAARTWRGAHARWLHRHACVLQHLVFAGAQRGCLLPARLDRRAAGDTVELRARIRRQAHGACLARATREQAQGTQRASAAPPDPEQIRRTARRANAATGPHRNR